MEALFTLAVEEAVLVLVAAAELARLLAEESRAVEAEVLTGRRVGRSLLLYASIDTGCCGGRPGSLLAGTHGRDALDGPCVESFGLRASASAAAMAACLETVGAVASCQEEWPLGFT